MRGVRTLIVRITWINSLNYYRLQGECVKWGQSLCVSSDTKGLSPFDTLGLLLTGINKLNIVFSLFF